MDYIFKCIDAGPSIFKQMYWRIIILLLAVTPCLSTINCSKTRFYEGSCALNFKNTGNNNDNCSSFDFVNCEWQECGGWYYFYSRIPIPVCGFYVTRYETNWYRCARYCCDSEVNYPPNWDSVRSCDDYHNQASADSSTRTKIIIGVVFGLLGGSCAIVVICRCVQNCCYSRRVSAERRHNLHQPDTNNQQQQQQQQQLGCDSPTTQNICGFQPVEDQSHRQRLKECCSVCLEFGVSLQLQCGHCYHRKCIVEWVSRKAECILCRSVNINHVKVYCQGCVRYYRKTTLLDNLKKLAEIPVRCLNCRVEL